MNAWITKLREVLGDRDNRRRYLIPAAAVLFVLLMYSLFIPAVEPLPVVKLPQTAEGTEKTAAGSAKAAAPMKPLKAVTLHSPFEAAHPDRESSVKRESGPRRQAASSGKGTPAAPRREPVRLVGTAVSSSGMRAILSRGSEQWSMAIGDHHGDVVLLELTEDQAVIGTSGGEAVLRLPGR